MKQRELLVLKLLKKSPKGCIYKDFNEHVWENVHFGDAVLRLRSEGHKILMLKEYDKKGIERGRYFYLGFDKEKAETPKAVKETKRNKAIQLALEGQKSDNKELRLFASRIYNILK